MRRIQPPPDASSPLDRVIERAARGLSGLLGRNQRVAVGDVQELEISARKLGAVLQLSVANPSRVFLSTIEVVLLIEFYDLDHTAQKRREVEFLSPGEEVMLAIAVESDKVSRLWCTMNYTLRGERRSATGGVELG